MDVSERTPLTRKRMTELEEELEEHNRIWTALYPHYPFDVVRAKMTTIGLEETVKEIKTAAQGAPPTPQQTNPSEKSFFPAPPPPTHVHTGSQAMNLAIAPSNTSRSTRAGPDAYSPTRPRSPHTLSLNIDFEQQYTSRTTSSEWNENESPWEDAPRPPTANAAPSNDFGTGVAEGVGYFGLSSGSTLLRMIRKLDLENNVTLSYRLEPVADFLPRIPDSRLRAERREALALPPARETGPLVDSYFRYFHALTPIVHEPTIRAQLTGALPLPAGNGSHVLFYMIFAMGACDYATDNAPRDAGSQYYELARAALQYDLLEGGSLLLVQGLAIMAIFLQRNDKPNTSYICLGLAIRIAMALGLHVSSSSGNVTLETGLCMTYGRPHTVSLPSLSSARLPKNTEDEYLTVSSIQHPPDLLGVTRYTPLIKQAKLAQMALHSLDYISRLLPSPTVEQIKWCGDYFRDKLAELPAYMQTATPPPDELAWAIQTWRARDCMSVLYRPVFLSAAWSSAGLPSSDEQVRQIIDTCRTLAIDNLRDIAHFVRTNPDARRGCEWYTLYYGIQASLTILLSIVSDPHSPCATSWRERIMDTMSWLRQLRSMKPLAMAWVQIMEKVLSARPGLQPGRSAEGPRPGQVEENLAADIDTFDFERYLSEIWDDQTQAFGLSGELGLSVWGDTTMGLPGSFH
ncbi:hypothetical protein NM208_g9957 [Fusarium decemcellulare]|uniref:Uncharacterized protein n=1 Tax=Fusarium decemcellulare TaxID=57161 RepID=A0ACC1RZN0_9HYPO|nr:hypothetical protein NM208_g9957 [Fusarium decemcellulare]